MQDAERVTEQIDHILTGEKLRIDLAYQFNFIFHIIHKYDLMQYDFFLHFTKYYSKYYILLICYSKYYTLGHLQKLKVAFKTWATETIMVSRKIKEGN